MISKGNSHAGCSCRQALLAALNTLLLDLLDHDNIRKLHDDHNKGQYGGCLGGQEQEGNAGRA